MLTFSVDKKNNIIVAFVSYRTVMGDIKFAIDSLIFINFIPICTKRCRTFFYKYCTHELKNCRNVKNITKWRWSLLAARSSIVYLLQWFFLHFPFNLTSRILRNKRY